MVGVAVLGGVFALAGCGGSGGELIDTSSDALGTRYHYEPTIEDVSFNAGCGIPTEGQTDCTFGFTMTYQKAYADLSTTVTHTTDNAAKTVDITVDTWSTSQIHPMIVIGPQTDDLGLLGADVGEKYEVTVHDRKDHVIWSGKVETLYHL
jgi:hypothetical protein